LHLVLMNQLLYFHHQFVVIYQELHDVLNRLYNKIKYFEKQKKLQLHRSVASRFCLRYFARRFLNQT
jgi:hypothetical protein